METSLRSRTSLIQMATWILVLLTLFIRLSLTPRIFDDAYITFRYAENLANGLGLVYNQGERVLGTTTPLFAFVLTVLRTTLGMEPTIASHWISALADAATAWILIRLGLMLLHSSWRGLAVGLLFALSPLAIGLSISGMESSLAVALILGAFLAYLERRRWLIPLLLALAFVTRPEAILVTFLVTAGFAMSRDWRGTRQTLLGLVAFLTPWLLFAWIYFGSPIPHSILAKSTQVYRWGWSETTSMFISHLGFLFLGYPLARMTGVAWPGAVPHLGPAAGWSIAVFLALIQGVLVIIGMRQVIRIRRDAWPLLAFPILYVGAYLASATRNVLIFTWYLAPLTPLYYLFIFGGIAAISKAIRRPHLEGALLVVLVLAQISGWQLRAPEPAMPLDARVGREQEYRDLALRFKDEFGTEKLVAAAEIGALGYFSEARILDTVGLISPEALKYYPLPEDLYETSYAIPPDLITSTQPDYVVTMEVFAEKGLLTDLQFVEEYCEVYRNPSDAFRGTNLLVFQRADPDC